MGNPRARELENAAEYAKRRHLVIKEIVGAGQDGSVFSTDVATAIKSFKYDKLYAKELAVYRRLAENGAIARHLIPFRPKHWSATTGACVPAGRQCLTSDRMVQ